MQKIECAGEGKKEEVEVVLSRPESLERHSTDKANYFKIIGSKRIRVTAIREEKKFVVITAVIK